MSPLLRGLLLPWNLLMMAACFTLFTWIVHDRRMPGWPDALDRVKHGSLLRLGVGGVGAAVLADVLLIAGFGLVHALHARPRVSLWLGQRVARPLLRTLFMTSTAAAWLLVLFCWQHTGVTVWDARPALGRLGIATDLVDTLAPLLPFAFVLLCLGTVVRHGAFEFIGLRQLLAAPERTDAYGVFRGERAPVLLTHGIYGVVRHPMYLYLLAAVVVRPVLSLDMLVFFASAVAFLCVAVPYEEEKLVALFGEAYREYQRRTPAFVPFWPMRAPSAPALSSRSH